MNASTDSGAALRAEYTSQGGTAGIFSGKVADYIVSRPDYPAALFDALVQCGALPAGADVADIGAGTGLLTHALLQRGHRVTAVEPNDEMRSACDASLGAHPGYRSTSGRAEATGLAEASVDLITAAQAFHWFDVMPARHEALRILRPAGQVALVWNDRVGSDPLQVALDALFAEFGGSRRSAMLAHDDRSQVPEFFGGMPQQQDFAHQHRLDLAGLLSLVFSRSYMPARESDDGRRAVRAIEAVFARFADAGRVAMRYRTVLMLGRPNEPRMR
ncbi:class I SAM-dependent methyltransferase [Ideonella sp. BN130291]|uniref:class I SAM-dependent methyltransferase n=1 Tax=Ideonella sp. BN130291 TaxID=3112940 RepID=UPI002E25946C|nr:class I SAM-dependent methyltransferase [Ideonella sp. BN130291]